MVGSDEAAMEAASQRKCRPVKYQIIVLPRAKADASDIYDYLANHNAAAAERFADNLEYTLSLQASIPTPGSPWLSTNPLLSDIRWTRVKGFRRYLIFLRVREAEMEVVRIIHGARDLESLLMA